MKKLIRWFIYELHAIEYGFYLMLAYCAYNMGESKDGEEFINHANRVVGRIDTLGIQP